MKYQPNYEMISGLRVTVRDNDVNSALRKLKHKTQDSGLLQELRDREHYEKPTTARKKAKSAAKARTFRALQTDTMSASRQRKY